MYDTGIKFQINTGTMTLEQDTYIDYSDKNLDLTQLTKEQFEAYKEHKSAEIYGFLLRKQFEEKIKETLN